VNLDAGVVFNIANKATYKADNANFDYEAVYKLDNNGVPIYDNSPVPDPNSWLITKAHYEKVNNDGKVDEYFENLYSQGYNVGLNNTPNTRDGDIKNATVNTSWFIRPGISYRIKPNLALHANFSYQQIKTNFDNTAPYKMTDKRGTYSSMSNGISSNSQALLSFGVGIRYYFGKEKVEKLTPPPAPPVVAPEPVKEPVKVDPYKEMVKVTVKLQDEKYGKPVAGNIIIKKGNATVYNGVADNSGISNFYLEPGNYTINISAKGYIPAEENLTLNPNEKGTSKIIELKQPKIEKGLVFKLKAINFETGSNQLTTSSFNILDKMAEILVENPQMVIEVAGHTDNVGDDQKNLELSQKRANEVMTYLTTKGAKASQMKAIGYGETKPIAENETPEGRLQNRRVMFTVLEF
jgi:outer membrane protein OmpA-like peptidoglycan-associated protein